MTDKLWKKVERNVAAFLGGVRVPITGRQRGSTPDVEHPFFSIEVKHRETMPFWILDAIDQADAAGRADKLPLVVLHMKGQAIEDSLTVMRLSDILKMYQIIGGKMEKLEEIETIIKIRLRRGEIDSAKFESWLVMAGLTPEEADKRLDELIKEVEEE